MSADRTQPARRDRCGARAACGPGSRCCGWPRSRRRWCFPSHAALINEIAIVALFALSLDLVLGYTGIVSLGHAAFFGMGAYAAALFAKHCACPTRWSAWRSASPRPPCSARCAAQPSCAAPT